MPTSSGGRSSPWQSGDFAAVRPLFERTIVRLDTLDWSISRYGNCWIVDLVDGRRWYIWEADLAPVTLTPQEEAAWLLRLLTA